MAKERILGKQENRRHGLCHNRPNTYTFPMFRGFFVKREDGKNATLKNKNLKTSTTTAQVPRSVYHRLRNEHDRLKMQTRHDQRRSQDERDGLRRRLQWHNKQSRLSRAEERTRIAAAACVGVWKGPQTPDSEWEGVRERVMLAERLARAK
jgi:hypothetical protein